ncbi:MAG TPA: TlpA disulfide reductase family protein [Dissulfurispiraceae bacterium]|nr:TlpA disulfide reductase family protein [Dissulfurispiraceae bacterium]
MPRTELHDMSGARVVIPDDIRGDVVVVRFWADCCSYNIYEMEAVHIMHVRYSDRGFSVITVYSGNSKETARGFIDELKIPYPVLLDVGGEVAGRFGISRLPTTFILDRNGVIREKIIGDTERQTWRDRYDGVIAALLQ